MSTHATFLENDYMTNYKPRSKVVLEKMLAPAYTFQPTRVVELREEEETTVPNQDAIVPRRSGREIRLPVRYRTEANVIVSDTNDDDPMSFREAMDDPDKEKWQEAMNQEMESMYSNSVWELVDPPEDVRTVGCKWI